MPDDVTLLPTQRALTRAELAAVLAPLGRVSDHWTLSGGTFASVQGVAFSDGTTVAVKTAVPDAAHPSGRSRLLGYEHHLLRTERDFLALLERIDGVPAPAVLLWDDSLQCVDVEVLVMSLMPGMSWADGVEVMTADANARASSQVGEILAAVSTVRGPSFGMPAQGFRLGGSTWASFLERLLASVLADAAAWSVDIAPERLLAGWEVAREALDEVTTPGLVHADLWHGNVLVDPQSGEVTGVVDFERSLYGDPLWGFSGAETHASGPFDPAKVAGYERAIGRSLPNDARARQRVALYRLWSMAVQLIEIEPRGFTGGWVDGHRASIVANRERLFAILGV
ncbi:phosphotransferase family protein [Demequina sp.]|uniref:phosphotransferase family protein n=1 Tax=Demequina sp. TaxID=2050685 RepID=UPI003A8C21C2